MPPQSDFEKKSWDNNTKIESKKTENFQKTKYNYLTKLIVFD